MALRKAIIGLPFTAGISTKESPYTVAPPRLLELENASFIRPGQLTKRLGSVALSRSILTAGGGTYIDSGQALMSFQDELVLADGRELYSRDVGNSAWVDKGRIQSVHVTAKSVIRDTGSQTNPDGNTAPNGIQVFAWQENSGISYTAIDTVTGQTIVPPTVLAAAGYRPKVLVFGDRFIILYAVLDTPSYINGATFPIGNVKVTPTIDTLTDPTGGTLENTLADFPKSSWDATVFVSGQLGTMMYLAFNNNTMAGGTTLFAFQPTGDPSVNAYPLTFGELNFAEIGYPVCVFGDPVGDGPVVVRTDNGESTTTFHAYSADLVTALGNNSWASSSVNFTNMITGVSIASTGSVVPNWQIAWSSLLANNNYTSTVNVLNYVDGTPSVLRRSVSLYGKAFMYNGDPFVPVFFASSTQPTAFVIDAATGYIASKELALVAGARANSVGYPAVPEVANIDGTLFRGTLSEKVLLATESTGPGITPTVQTYSPLGVTSVDYDFFNPYESWLRAEAAGLLNISGGFIQAYDGLTPVELGFHLYPEIVSVSIDTGTPGGHLPEGDYWWTATYEWEDRPGHIQRSAPAFPVKGTVGAGLNGAATVVVSTLRMTAKLVSNGRSPVNIVIYRTQGNPAIGGLYTRVYAISSDSNSPTTPIVNDATTDTSSFADNYSDATIVGNQGLYTNGGVVENDMPNAVSSLTVFGGRLWAVDSTGEQLTLWYSKFLSAGSPPDFSAEFTLNVDPRGGPITAIAAMDEKLIIFKRDHVFKITGRGPDNTGGQDAFQDAELINTDMGCVNPRSVTYTDRGLMCESDKGLYLLNRGGQAEYIGAPAESFNGNPVTSGLLLATTNQVRFTLAQTETLPGGARLVYDYYAGQWGSDPNIAAVDSTLFGGQYVWLRDDGVVFQEVPGIYTDNGNFISRRVVTSWIQLAGLQGFQRIFNIMLLGAYVSPHKLRISIAYDFNPTPAQTAEVTPVMALNYGLDSVYGGNFPSVPTDNATYGGAFPVYMWQVGAIQQKCTSFQITIEDIPIAGELAGQASTFVGISVEYGVMTGLNRLPARQSS